MSALLAARTGEHLADPFATYRRLRIVDPIHWDARARAWLVVRYTDVRAGLCAAMLSSHRPLGSTTMENPKGANAVDSEVANWLIRLDPPKHKRLRTHLTRALRASVNGSAREAIQTQVDGLLERARRAGGMEVISEFAAPLAGATIMDLIGIPCADHAHFRKRAEEIAAYTSGGGSSALADAAQNALVSTRSYLADVIASRRATPRQDLITALVHPHDAATSLGDHEIAGLCALLVLAGHETTTYSLAHAIRNVLAARPISHRLRYGPITRDAVEELLRYDTPIQGVLRVADADHVLGDDTFVQRGERVLLLLGAANRDPTRFTRPDELDLSRNATGHLAFGAGIHRCPGATIARTVMHVALNALIRQAPQLRQMHGTVEWEGNPLFRHLRSISLEF